MQFGRLARALAHAAIAMLMLSVAAARGSAHCHDDHGGAAASQRQKMTREQGALVKAVREATERFRHVTSPAGPGEGYQLMFGCVSGGDFGAMGLHYVNGSLLDGNVNVQQPEIVLFEPTANGGIRITRADYLVLAADWEANHKNDGPPQLMGQLFHFFEAPNRFELPPFYTLHVWAWKHNPNGTFVNWNPNVSCDGFNTQQFDR